MGSTVEIISARIIDEFKSLGPEYDHMSICIETPNKRYLADVGYGDLFPRPLEIKEGIQRDGETYLKFKD